MVQKDKLPADWRLLAKNETDKIRGRGMAEGIFDKNDGCGNGSGGVDGCSTCGGSSSGNTGGGGAPCCETDGAQGGNHNAVPAKAIIDAAGGGGSLHGVGASSPSAMP